MNKIRVLHIALDDKFFDSVFKRFNEDKRLENQAIIVPSNEEGLLKYVKTNEGVSIVTYCHLIESVNKLEFDCVFFHSLSVKMWNLVLALPKDKIVIWWAWGYDTYSSFGLLKPFIKVDLYKPLTGKLLSGRHNQFLTFGIKCLETLESLKYVAIRNNVLKRVDFFQPVNCDEYLYMQRNKAFRAKEFYYPNSFSFSTDIETEVPSQGNIIVGNSATYSNNHMDILSFLLKAKLQNRNIYLPLSYGQSDYVDTIESSFSIPDCNTICMKDFLPRDEFFKFFSGCSYMVSGCMRQQSMGNISFALSKGIKVFCFKDSIVYKYLKGIGFTVSPIEGIDERSFNTPLNLEERRLNAEVFVKEMKRRHDIYESFIRLFESFD